MGGLFGGGGGGGSTQTVTKSDPWEGMQPYLTDLMKKAQGAYNTFKSSGYDQPFSGPRSAGANSFDTQATDSALGAIPKINSQNTFDLGQFFNDKVTSGGYQAPGNMAFDSGTNPARTDAIMANVRPVLNDFTENMIPKLNSAAISSGAYGGSKDSDLRGRALRDTNQTLADTASKISYQDFLAKNALDQQDLAQRRALMPQLNQQELAAGTSVPQFANAGLTQDLQPSQIYSNVADKERGFAQQGINDQLANWSDLVASPFAGLGDYSGLINGAGASARGAGTATQVSPGEKGSGWLGSLASGLGGIGTLGSSLGALGGAYSSLGGLAGTAAQGASFIGPAAAGTSGFMSALGTLGSFFSDRRTKENIVPEGTRNGHKVYSFNYIWDKAKRFLGVMAQDMLEHPAISQVLGIYTIDYNQLGFEMEAI